LLDWSDSDGARFSHPTFPFKVLYLGPDKMTCFWERFGQELLDQNPADRALSEKEVAERVWKQVTISADPALRLLDLRDARVQRQLGADAATFLAAYEVTQAWALALMTHPANIQGIIYNSRLNAPNHCVALFDRVAVAPGAKSPLKARVLALKPIDDASFLRELIREGIRFPTLLDFAIKGSKSSTSRLRSRRRGR